MYSRSVELHVLDMFHLWCIFLAIPSQPEGALPGTLWNVGVGAAPAGVEGTSLCVIGRPWVTVRPTMGSATEVGWTGTGKRRKRRGFGRPRPRKRGPRVLRRRDGTSRGVAVCLCFPAIREISRGRYQGAPFGVPPPSLRIESEVH
jgi:hypothetical protein